MALLKLSPPWHIFYKELDCLFREDEEVRIIFDEDNNKITMFVDNTIKAEALEKILPKEKKFANVTISIDIVPSNAPCFRNKSGSVYEDAFSHNPILNDVITVAGIMTNSITYVIFRKEVVQYWTDNLGDAHGVCSTLYEDIARDIFEFKDGIYFCTDTDTKTIKTTMDGNYFTYAVGSNGINGI